ncbi:MAG: hypothetical protein C0493_07360 [Kytococcus sp.]|nr:hypothetical protein [Kytococcus sp.]
MNATPSRVGGLFLAQPPEDWPGFRDDDAGGLAAIPHHLYPCRQSWQRSSLDLETTRGKVHDDAHSDGVSTNRLVGTP